MHELSIIRNIVAIVSDAANGCRVSRVTIEIGKLSGVMGDAIAFCFDVVAQGNLLSSPGAGKTTLLERTIRHLREQLPLFVIEGDQATANDGLRIRAAGAPVVQINTGTGCHLEADLVAHGLKELEPSSRSIVLIENVGNLVCPAMFDLGERAKVVILSTAEGEDKPLKYPHMFRAAAIMLINKIDLLPHADFDVECAIANARQVNPGIAALRVSARIRRETVAARVKRHSGKLRNSPCDAS